VPNQPIQAPQQPSTGPATQAAATAHGAQSNGEPEANGNTAAVDGAMDGDEEF